MALEMGDGISYLRMAVEKASFVGHKKLRNKMEDQMPAKMQMQKKMQMGHETTSRKRDRRLGEEEMEGDLSNGRRSENLYSSETFLEGKERNQEQRH